MGTIMGKIGRLNVLAVSRASKPGFHSDGGGLYLQVTRGGARTWVYRFMLHGKAREMGLGSLRDIALAEARKRAAECRRLRSAGTDPIQARIAARKEAELEAARALTFKQCATAYIESHRDSWRNAKHRAQWSSTLETYAYPVIGHLSVQAIETAHIMKILKPMWATKASTAARLRGRIECVFDWAKAHGNRTGENPARWRGHIENMLPALSKVRIVQHHKALPYAEITAFMETLRGEDAISARALELLILTATRTSEAINARWQEFDLERGIWTIPAERMKAAREHRVPLSAYLQRMLEALPRIGDYLFPGGRYGKPLSNMAMLVLLKRMGFAHITAHGFRSTFRDWVSEQTNHQHEAAEMALAHTVSNKVEAAYRRGDLFEKRRTLMEDWARQCAGAVPAKVVQLRERVRN